MVENSLSDQQKVYREMLAVRQAKDRVSQKLERLLWRDTPSQSDYEAWKSAELDRRDYKFSVGRQWLTLSTNERKEEIERYRR